MEIGQGVQPLTSFSLKALELLHGDKFKASKSRIHTAQFSMEIIYICTSLKTNTENVHKPKMVKKVTCVEGKGFDHMKKGYNVSVEPDFFIGSV